MKKRLRIILLSLLALIIVATSGFFIYVSDYYRADAVATALAQSTSVTQEGNLTLLSPKQPTDTALIFYPGGKVEAIAYLPLLKKIEDRTGIVIILVEMPFNLAVFDANAADKVIEKHPEIKNWFIAGHSLGGAMASQYASKHPDKVQGLILLGAYIYGDYPPENTLTLYGTLNQSVADKIDYTENVVAIEGGNHAQFGNYGRQKGDLDATISADLQQDIAADAIQAFLLAKAK